MSSVSRHHAEWLSLLEISGPFLSLPVLLDAFPQGLDTYPSEQTANLRAAYEEWLDNQGGLAADPAIHTAWVRYVLAEALGYTPDLLLGGQAIPVGIKATIAEHGETLRPDLVLQAPGGKPRLLIQIYPATQGLDKPPAESHWQASAAARMMDLLHATEIRLGLVTNGEQWTLVDAPIGETTGYISWYASLWFEEPLTLRAFRNLLETRRFFGVPDEQTLEALLAASAQDQYEVTDQLGHQVRRAVEILIQSIDRADQDRGRELLASLSVDRLYEAALTVMMRLVFLLSTEERKLLPIDDPFYAQNYAVSTLRAQLHEVADQATEQVLEYRYDAWSRLLATFRVVFSGIRHDRLNLPAYGGSLFDPDRYPFLEGRLADTSWKDSPAKPLPIHNRTVLHLLDAIQVLQVKVPGGGQTEARRLSFRALDVEQIGHVYEGLLDHRATRAEGPVLGLAGTKDKEPEISLAELQTQQAKEEKAWLDYLHDQTGRSESALRNGLKSEPETEFIAHLRSACGNDQGLFQKVLPFAGLIRDDDFGFPVVIPSGSVYVTAGTSRRATGTHYTPRSLTEPIVKHTLEPQVYRGPSEGRPPEKWELKSPNELLDLKVCDMAMGSAGFLVQADRYLAERLVEAWAYAEERHGIQPFQPDSGGQKLDFYLTTEGLITDDLNRAIPSDPDDRLVFARRLVAERCLYGVDKNPLAVEIAKLSLWLVTLAKERPFTFLDHALKCGDSLVGASEDDFLRWAHSDLSPQGSLFDEILQQRLESAREKRLQLKSFQVLDVRDAERKMQLLKEADKAMARIYVGCDLITGVKLLGLNQSEQEGMLARMLLAYMAGEEIDKPDARRASNVARSEHAFHWEFEFPEVFKLGGFNAFIGNPPFIGGGRISSVLGEYYFRYLRLKYTGSHGQSDICALFFRQTYNHLVKLGTIGLIATNTIAQGDTRETGLDYIINQQGGKIYWVSSPLPWPGTAAVFISIVHIQKGQYHGKLWLNSDQVDSISPFLDSLKITALGKPYHLKQNVEKAFRGVDVLGMGFVLSPAEADELIKKNPQNKTVLFPYLVGQDLNRNPDQSPDRWVINFFDWPLQRTVNGYWNEATEGQRKIWLRKGIVPTDYPAPVAADYPDCLAIVKERVYPERIKNPNKQRREIWWRFTRPRVDLLERIQSLGQVMVKARVADKFAIAFVPIEWVYSDRLVVFTFDDYANFAILQSNFNEAWSRFYGSTLKMDMLYNPSDCFETFPFPLTLLASIEKIGKTYHEYRQQIMLNRGDGLTATYNLFHNPKENSGDITRLRTKHVEMDDAVAATYGWSDLDLEHDFHETSQGVRFTISESARRDVLSRLLELNHQRYQEEVAQGLHEKKGRKASRKGHGSIHARATQNKGSQSHKTSKPLQTTFYEQIAPRPQQDPLFDIPETNKSPTLQIGDWDQCICLRCGKHLAGFMTNEHTQTVHHGEDPGYRKVGG